MTRAVYQAIVDWPRPVTQYRTDSQFSTGLRETKALLDRETSMLNARSVVVALDIRPEDIRKADGEPKTNVRHGPRVAVLIERHDRYDPKIEKMVGRPPLAFYCDRFRKWEDNLRAIALGLEALRRVDRYGITSGDEQYAGWTAIAAKSETKAHALVVVSEVSGLPVDADSTNEEILGAVRAALKIAHPDRGGSRELFERVQSARQALNA